MGSKNRSQVIGYRYLMGLHMGLGLGPVDSIMQARVGDIPAFTGPAVTGNRTVRINRPDLFGGDKGEGGIRGDATFLFGGESQVAPARLKRMLGGDQPDFRGIVTVYFDGMVTAMNPYPKPWKWKVRRNLKGWEDDIVWFPERAIIPLDPRYTGPEDGSTPGAIGICPLPGAESLDPGTELSDGSIHAQNPIHIIYECLTNQSWGRGIDAEEFIDDANFREAATQLYNEGFGLCMKWNRKDTTIEQFIQMVLDHIGGVLRVSKLTGLFEVVLLRRNYSLEDLPVYTLNSGILSISSSKISSLVNAANELEVTYQDPYEPIKASVKQQNLASIQASGAINSATVEYPGIVTPYLAARVAQRDLRLHSVNLRRFDITADRSLSHIQVGDVFILNDPTRDINGIVVRVGSDDEGGSSNNQIRISAVQDVFSLTDTVGGLSVSIPEHEVPITAGPDLVMDMPYTEVVRSFPRAELAALPSNSGIFAAYMMRLDPRMGSFIVDVEGAGGQFFQDGGNGPTPTALLRDGVEFFDTEILVQPVSAFNFIDPRRISAIAVNDEIMRVDAIDMENGVFTVARGVADTIPAQHFAGSIAWFITGTAASDFNAYSLGTVKRLRLYPVGGEGSASDVPPPYPKRYESTARYSRPYPPANVQVTVSSVTNPWFETLNLVPDTDVLISYDHRDRVLQADNYIGYDEGSVGPEPGTTYRVDLVDASGVVIETLVTGETDDNITLSSSTLIGLLQRHDNTQFGMFLCLRSVRAGLTSHSSYFIALSL